jgi:hypothetical protein
VALAGQTISAALLAARLGEGLAAVVPGEVEVSVADSVVSLGKRGTPWGMAADLRQSPDPPPGPAGHDFHTGVTERIVERAVQWPRRGPPAIPVDSLEGMLVGLLDQFQDEVAETVAEPWPALTPDPMPEPFAEIRDGRLRAGYGDPSVPALTVLSVPLDDLR